MLRQPCTHCGGPVIGRKDKKWCSKSCRMRDARGVPPQKKFKTEPEMLCADVREWRTLNILQKYEISNDGRVRRRTLGSNRKVGTLLRASLSTRGYPEYRLYDDEGKPRAWSAHRLVALAFLPEPFPGQAYVLHRDDNKLNPVDSNLKWGTAQENSDDAVRNGRILRGDAHPARRKAA